MYPVISRQSYPEGATIVVTVGSLAFYKTQEVFKTGNIIVTLI